MIITLDLGTTSCRALLFDLSGHVLAKASRTYPLSTPHPGYAEQDPVLLMAAADQVVAEVAAQAPSPVQGISLCTYMHSLIAVAEDGSYLTQMVTWADGRAVAQVDEMRQRPDWHDLYTRTGCPPHTMYPIYKYRWFTLHQPETLRQAHRLASIKELLVHHWTGNWALDYNLASGTGMFNLHTLDWDPGALAHAGVRRDQLSEVVPTTQIYPLSFAGLGLPTGTPVVVGAGDGVLSSLGSGAIEPGIVAAMVGTSGAVRVCVPKPMADPQARVFCYYLAHDKWILGGSLNNGGIALRWLRDNQYPGAPTYDEILADAAKAPVGSGALLFLPYLAGERSPGFNARARGVWFGLGLEHTKTHMARSVLEAIAFRLYSVLGPIEEVAGPAKEIRATGGFARSDFWLQICADVFGEAVTVPTQAEGSSLGAFVMGAVALGIAPDFAWVHQFIGAAQRLSPSMENHAVYQELFSIYQRVKERLQPEFFELARFRERRA